MYCTTLALLTAMIGCFCLLGGAEETPTKPTKETVVLLHGMGGNRATMLVLKKRLEKAGFATLNFPYATYNKDLDQLSDALHAFVKDKVKTERYHFIGHSLGNIIVRNGFKKEYPPGLGRVVMLGPPNQPAKMAKRFSGNPLYRWICGDSGQKLGSELFYQDLPIPTVEFGIIAADRGQRITFKEANDGMVSVKNTKLKGMKAWILLHHTHVFLMNGKDTARHCIEFLRAGTFDLAE
jgi:triacylglycerol lipase